MKPNKKTPTNTRDWAVFILGFLTPLVVFSDKISSIGYLNMLLLLFFALASMMVPPIIAEEAEKPGGENFIKFFWLVWYFKGMRWLFLLFFISYMFGW